MATIADIRKQYPQYNDLSDRELAEGFHRNFYSDIPFDDFAQRIGLEERTVLGQIGETLKAVPRGVANTILSTGEGLAELADAATNVVGLKNLIDSGDENALVSASRAGRDWIANSALGADPTYQDAWFTKFGEGVGSMATFLAPVGILRGLGAAGKAIPALGTSARELAVTGALATGAGAGDQAQRIAAARERGLEVTQGQEDSAIALGGLIGLSEIAPIASILKRVPKNITPADKNRVLDLLQKAIRGGAEEAVQEAGAGLLQDFTEKGIYNPDLAVGESFWDDLTVGGAVGAFADFVVNAAAGRRSYITTEAQREFERKQREAEQKEIDRIRQAIRDAETNRANRQADPEGFIKAAEQAQKNAANILPPDLPSGVQRTPFESAKAYADSIIDELGEFFPANTKFTVERGPLKDVTRTITNAQGQEVEVVDQEPTFIVKDSAGNQYGLSLGNDEYASNLAFVLNNAVINQQVRGQVLNTLETSGKAYDQATADVLTRYGFQVLNPNKNLITSAAINEAAGTTADKGFAETVSFQTILDGNKTKDGYVIQGPNQQPVTVPGLTAAQQINQKRKEKGLPETQTFTVEEAREALGDKFENLTNINVAAIPDNMTYTATIVDGKPVVVSSANEVFKSRFASAEDSEASGKKEDGTPNIAVGQKINLQSLEDAQAFADRKNREAARGQGLSTKEINSLFKSEKTLNEELNRLLEAKNIGSKIDSPEVKTLFKSLIGKESLSDMSFGEQRLLYARLRTLPRFESLTQLPVFEAKPYTRDNFVRASKFVQDANSLGQSVTDDQIAQAAGLLSDDPRRDIKVAEIKKALNQQGVPTEKPAKPVLLLAGPDGTTDTYNFLREEIRKKMQGFGLEDISARIDQTLLNFGDPVRYMEEMGAETEGYYNPFLREITLAVDRIDPNKTLTPEQRVEALVDVLNHEIVHPVRELDLWTGQEWDTLSRAAAKLKRRDESGNPTNQTYLQWATQTYRDQGPLVAEEEAVADLSRQAKKFGAKAVAGKPKVLADRLFRFFDRLDNSFRGAGFQNYTDILDRLQSGEIGARTRGEIRTLRATEAAMAGQGILPERFSDYQPIRITPQARNQEREEKKVQVQSQAQAAGVTDFNPNALEGMAIRESRSTIENVPAKIDVDGRQVPTRDSENRLIYSGYEGPEVYGIETAPTQVGLKNFWNWFGKSKAVNRDGRPLVYYHGTAADITAFRPKQAGSVFITLNPRFAAEFSGLSENFMAGNFTDFLSDQQVLDVLNETLQSQSAFTPRTWDKVAKLRDSVANSVADNRPIRASVIKDLKEIAFDGSSIRFMNAIQTRMPSAANIVPVYVKAENPFDYQNVDHVRKVLKKADELSPTPLGAFEAEGVYSGDWGVIENSVVLNAIKELGFDSMYVEEAGQKNLAVFDPNQIKSAIGNNGNFDVSTPSIRESRVSSANAFEDKLIKENSVPEYKSREKLIEMNIDDFLMLAKPGYMDAKYKDTSKLLREGKKFSSLPFLNAYGDGKDFLKVQGHEGRHRALALKDAGYQTMPVILRTDIRWSEQDDPSKRDYQENWPTRIETEEGNESIPMPVSREDSNAPYGVITPSIRESRVRNPQIDTPEFQRFFKDSKATDETGEPQVFYHGATRDIDVFRPKPGRKLIFTSPEPNFASRYAANNMVFFQPPRDMQDVDWAERQIANAQFGDKTRSPTVYPLYVSAKNPFDFKNKSHIAQLEKDLPKILSESTPSRGAYTRAEIRKTIDEIKKGRWGYIEDVAENTDFFERSGYDSIYVEEAGVKNLAVFSPNQLKSAVGNVGAFDITRPSIRESRVAPRPELQLNEAVTKAEESVAKTPKTAIPLYNLNASPDALYVAENPEAGEQLDASDRLRYSRSNQPVYDPEVQEIIDRLAVTPPDETPGETIVNGLEMSPLRNMIDKFRQRYIFNYSKLELFNQRHPSLINNAADTNSLVAAEMADRSRAFTASAIKDGVPVYENGVVKIADFIHNGRQYRGLAEVMIPLYDNPYGNLEKLAQSYAIAIRGRRLQAEGKLAPGEAGDIEALEAAVNQYIDPNTNRPIIKDWYDAWQAYNAYTVQFLRDTGIIDDAGAQLWLDQSDYVPFYRETKAGPVAHPKIFGGLTSTTQLKAVGKSEEGIDMPLLNSILTNLDAAIAMGMKNVAQQRIVRDMIDIGLGRMLGPNEPSEGQMVVTFKVQGKKYRAVIDDPLIFESMQALPEMGISGMLETVFRVPANVLREMITREPGYMLANIMRDTASVTMTSQASLGSTVTAVKDFSDGFENLRRRGVIGGYDFARDPDNMVEYLAKAAKEMGHEIPSDYQSTLGKVARSPYFKPLTWAWDALGQLSDRAEALNRIRVYEDTLKRTGNEAEAIYQALSVINYGRRGRSPAMRALTAVVPFLNARIQGLDKLYQAGTGQFGPTKDRRKNALNFTVRAGLMVGLTVFYYSMVSDDEEYKNANPEVVDNYYLLPTPMDFAIRIPIPFEVGILFKTIPERIMRLNNDVDTWRDARASAGRAFFGTLAFNPVPQAVLPIAEVIANYDSFTGRSVIPPYMDERMAAEYQARFGTNELARILGEGLASISPVLAISPIKIDHLLNGYFGSLGTYTLDAVDHILRDADRAYPERKAYEYPFIRRFFADANQPGLQTQFYDLYREVGKVTNTIRQLREDGRTDELNAYLMENQSILAVKRNVDILNKRMKAYRDQRERILKSTLDPKVKQEMVDQLNENINVTLQVMPILRRAAFMEQNQTGE